MPVKAETDVAEMLDAVSLGVAQIDEHVLKAKIIAEQEGLDGDFPNERMMDDAYPLAVR